MPFFYKKKKFYINTTKFLSTKKKFIFFYIKLENIEILLGSDKNDCVFHIETSNVFIWKKVLKKKTEELHPVVELFTIVI